MMVVETPDYGMLRVHLPPGAGPRDGEAVRLGWSSAAVVPVMEDAAA